MEQLLRVEEGKRGWNTVYQAFQLLQTIQSKAKFTAYTVESI